jgi:hypothetical protein
MKRGANTKLGPQRPKLPGTWEAVKWTEPEAGRARAGVDV